MNNMEKDDNEFIEDVEFLKKAEKNVINAQELVDRAVAHLVHCKSLLEKANHLHKVALRKTVVKDLTKGE